MTLNIAVLPGDGVGPEVIAQALKVMKVISIKFNHNLNFSFANLGAIAIKKEGVPLPNNTLKVCKNSDAILFGAIGDPKYDNNPTKKIRPEQGLLELRKQLNLFANIRPVKAYETTLKNSPLKKKVIYGTDILIYRELTGGLYFGEKKVTSDGNFASDLCSYTRQDIEKISKLAFKAAKNRNNKLTLIDKANVLETSRLWRKVVKEIGNKYPEVKLDFLFVDNAAMQIVQNPKQFDVILTENLFGDIISDEASVIAGSIGLLASASVGDKHALFEPIHGSYPQATGKGIANPIASILSVAMLFEHFSLREEAAIIKEAVDASLKSGITTPDLNNKSSKITTEKVGSFIKDYIDKIH